MTDDTKKTDEQMAEEKAQADALAAAKELVANSEKGDSTEADPQADDKSKGDKKFTQAEVDQIVLERVAREKSSTDRKVLNAEAGLKAAELLIEDYEIVLGKQIEAMTADVPDNVKELLADRTAIKQLEWLADPKNTTTQRSGSPKTPLERSDTEEKEPEKIRKLF